MSASSSCDCCENLSQLGISICNVTDPGSLLETQEEIEEGAVKLPGIITVNESCTCQEYPIVKKTQLKNMFPKMCEILNNMYDYEKNLLSFWILDVFIEGLKTSQKAGMDHHYQKTTLLWIAFMFNYMQINDISRAEMFKYLFDLILPVPTKTKPGFECFGENEVEETENIYVIVPEDSIKENKNEDVWEIPLPPKLESTNMEESYTKESTKLSFFLSESNHKKYDTETNLHFMKVILEIIYRIFGRFWVFKALQMIFHQTPKAKIIDLPFKLHTPKPVMHHELSFSAKSGRSQKKQIEEEEIDPAVYKNDFILPLQLAEGAKAFVRELFNIPSKEMIPITLKKIKK